MPDKQSAYHRCHFTETALAKVLSDVITAINFGYLSLLVLLELSAAYDIVDHDILFTRLNDHSVFLQWCLTDLCHNSATAGKASVKVDTGVA
jgi:hypothetical protein